MVVEQGSESFPVNQAGRPRLVDQWGLDHLPGRLLSVRSAALAGATTLLPALKQSGTRKAVDPLTEALEDSDSRVNRAAMGRLRQFGMHL